MLLFAPCANSNCIFCSQLRRRNHTREHPALLNYSAVPLFGTNIPDMSVWKFVGPEWVFVLGAAVCLVHFGVAVWLGKRA